MHSFAAAASHVSNTVCLNQQQGPLRVAEMQWTAAFPHIENTSLPAKIGMLGPFGFLP